MQGVQRGMLLSYTKPLLSTFSVLEYVSESQEHDKGMAVRRRVPQTSVLFRLCFPVRRCKEPTLACASLPRSVTRLVQGGKPRRHSCCTDEGGVPEAHERFELRLDNV